MIKKEHITTKLLEACPSFQPVYDASDDKELDYIIASDFAHHLLDLYINQKQDKFPQVGQMIEALHIDGDSYVKEYATIGILEGIQNVWSNNKTDPKKFAEFLLPVSLQYWKSLNKFWAGEIPIVGRDIK